MSPTFSHRIESPKFIKMDLWMSAMPAGGPGAGCGSGGYIMRKNSGIPVVPQVTLDMKVHPPVLDTSGLKPAPSKSSNSCGGNKLLGGQLWTSLRNMYKSFKCSSAPVTWVNPDMVPQFQPLQQQQQQQQQNFYLEGLHQVPEAGIAAVSQESPPLWYAAAPGSHYNYQDPLQLLAYQYYNMDPVAHQGMFMQRQQSRVQKASQPLNPEAKEWVPRDFQNNKDRTSSTPKGSCFSPEKNVQNSMVFASVCEFVEITNEEIDDVRSVSQSENPKISIISNTVCGNVEPDSKSSTKVIASEESNRVAEGSVEENYSCSNSWSDTVPKKDQNMKKHNSQNTAADHGQNGLTLSYATVTRKSPEPATKAGLENDFEDEISPSVKQPLPKIFLKDKKYPKEKAVPLMDSKQKEPLPFRTGSKTQKRSSRKFLNSLRDLSPAKSDCSYSGSEGSFESGSEIMSRLGIGNSFLGLPSGSSPVTREKVIPFSNCTSNTKKSQRSVSESSGSSCHNRTTSESSTGSVESVDIEFNDCDITDVKMEKDNVIETCKSKHPNSILSHILGLDSDSEDSDDETDDSDWDNTDECDSVVLDDSWETFGLAIPLITSSPCSNNVIGGCKNSGDNSESICDNSDYFNCNLDDVNKRWEDNITKDLKVASPCRVSFGNVTVRPMVMWSYAYRNARKGPWEQHARDRARFINRVMALEPVLSPIFSSCHREAMYSKIYGS